jgi:hypothetical protein
VTHRRRTHTDDRAAWLDIYRSTEGISRIATAMLTPTVLTPLVGAIVGVLALTLTHPSSPFAGRSGSRTRA